MDVWRLATFRMYGVLVLHADELVQNSGFFAAVTIPNWLVMSPSMY